MHLCVCLNPMILHQSTASVNFYCATSAEADHCTTFHSPLTPLLPSSVHACNVNKSKHQRHKLSFVFQDGFNMTQNFLMGTVLLLHLEKVNMYK